MASLNFSQQQLAVLTGMREEADELCEAGKGLQATITSLIDSTKRGDLTALLALKELRGATYAPMIALWLSTNTGSRLTCMMPNNQHFINTLKRYTCKSDSSHTFCANHALSSCPICNGKLR